MICGKKFPTKITALIIIMPNSASTGPALWPRNMDNKIIKGNVNSRGVYSAMGNGCEPTGTRGKNEEILEEALVEPIAMVRKKEC